jgi:formylglycine-generating enzyme required for sulfatase activity
LLPPGTERRIELRQLGDRLIAGQSPGAGSPIALLRAFQSRLKIEPLDDFWEGGDAPRWASAWGRDEHGPWLDLRLVGARQRLRWIPPGEFWMGSPEDEEGRFAGEGPRHEQTIGAGFWMFDTPCTQTLWEAVMRENPSNFQGPFRPVENVSWDQCQEFLKRLNGRLEGLELKLPSEAQWEYACRAGTETPRYRERLSEIAWYLDNSNRETHPVALKAANAWGLFDTLGNVWEWCDDVWTDDYKAKNARVASAARVVRGGSWLSLVRYVRAASRGRYGPGYRLDPLGFRCAEFGGLGPASWERGQGAQRVWERGGVGTEHPGDLDRASGAGWINLDAPDLGGVALAAPVRVSSDVEQVVLRTKALPEWASAVGRDRYGLWAELTIEGMPAKPPRKRVFRRKAAAPAGAPSAHVRQRLRWIPPGRFLMGSPPDEPGRYSDEGPQHDVTIAQGFWMFDTPCTQALWEAVMGENPSRFPSPDRPVESVS